LSEFHVPVVRLCEITKHPNADSLSVTKVFDYPVVIRSDTFQTGDLAVYVPVDAVVPFDDPRWDFLQGHHRIKAKRLRGIFSMGLLTDADPSWEEGQQVGDLLGITKYEPPVQYAGGQAERDPGFIPVYTDMEGLRRYPDILQEGEEVVITEKLHGANARFVYYQDRLWVGSHTQIKRQDPNSPWWKAAEKLNLGEVLQEVPGLVFYGEVFGNVQDLKYGMPQGIDLRFFDAFSISEGKYLDWVTFEGVTAALGLPVVPILYRGPWGKHKALLDLAEGGTFITSGDHMREGFVVKPVRERWTEETGRVILKLVGEGYLLRKGG
jgi:RNA ligase (TIGR02306 family)